MGKIMLAEYARRNGIDPATAKKRAQRKAFKTAEKMGKFWMIDEDEEFVDQRIKSGNYVNARNQKNNLEEDVL